MAAQIFVVSGASGAGKTTLVKALQAADPQLRFSVSYTTRPPRPGEEPGRDYFFVSLEEFQRLIADQVLLEYVQQFGYYYGTSRDWITEALAGDQDLLFDVEHRGALAIKEAFPEAVCIFILPPSPAELEARLRSRGQLPPGELEQRLNRARKEIEQVEWYDYLVINDDLATALQQLQAIITAQRCRSTRLWPLVKERWQLQTA